MPKKILLVDDEIDIVEMLEEGLKGYGYEIVKAGNGLEGMVKAKETMPDLIITDEMMPKMDGYKMAGLLKADTRFQNIPIILFTARAQELDENISQEVGIDAYLTKAISIGDLAEKVKNIIGE